MIDVSTQTDPDEVHAENHGSVNVPVAEAAHTFLELTAPLLTSTVREVLTNTQSMEHERTLQELADAKAQITQKDERIEHYRRLHAEVTESRDQQTQQYNEIQTQPDEANINISESAASESRSEEQAASSQVEVNDLRTALEEATLRVSELEVERDNLGNHIELKDGEIKKLKDGAVKTRYYIGEGIQELRGFLGLSAKLYNRLNKVEKMGKGALGRDDGLMRSAVQNLARWNGLVEKYFRDVVRTEAEVVSEPDLAIVGRPADYSAINQVETGDVYEVSADDSQLEQLVDEIYGAADTNGDVSDVDGVEGPASENAEVEEPKAKSRKTSQTASIFAAAAGIDLSSSSPSSAAKGKQKEERAPAFGEEGSSIFSFSFSEDGVRAEQTPRYQDPEDTRQSFNFPSANAFNFFATTAKGEEKDKPASVPAFGAEGSSQFSFSSRGSTPKFDGSSGSSVGAPLSTGDRGEDKQKHESTDKATNDLLFSAEAFAKFNPGPSGMTFNFGNITFPTMGASEGQVDSSPSSSNSGTTVAGEDGGFDPLYDIEEGYIPPAERLRVVDQAGVKPASTVDTNEGEDADGDSTGVPRITITPASTVEHKAEAGNSNILERNGFDVAELSRIVGSGCPVAQEDPEDGSGEGGNLERRNLDGENHEAESLCERLLPREGHYPSFAEATGIQNVVWQGRSRTAKEILSDCEKGLGAKDGMEEDLALIISGIENLHLRSSRPSAGSRTRMQNARIGEDDRRTEREVPKDAEPQTKVVKEDVRTTRAAEAQRDVPLISQPNELSSATIVDDTVQPRMGMQVESTAPSSSSSSSYSSSSEAPVSTPPAAHESPEPERRSKLGNPLDENGRLYLWRLWPLRRKKKSRATV